MSAVLRHAALATAAYAGQLAGIACQALLEAVAPQDTPPQPVDDFDEAAAEKYLTGAAWNDLPNAAAGDASPPDAPAADAAQPPASSPDAGAARHPTGWQLGKAARAIRAWADGIECPDPDEYRAVANTLRNAAIDTLTQ